jgi:hypothetical protein
MLRLKLLLVAKPMGTAQPALFVLGHDKAGRLRCVRLELPVRSSAVEMFDCLTGKHFYAARYRGNAFAGEFTIPLDIFSPAHALFVKLERRSWFFDEAGWLETAAAARSDRIRVQDRALIEGSSRAMW